MAKHGVNMSLQERFSVLNDNSKPCNFAKEDTKYGRKYNCLTCGDNTRDCLRKAQICKHKKP